MWQLICHHTYKWRGLPVDLSPHGSDGSVHAAVFQPNGANTGSGALNFNGAAAVRVPAGAAWKRLRGIKVECVVRGALGTPAWLGRTLVEGDGSFSFLLVRDGVNPTLLVGAGSGAAGLNSFNHAPSGFPVTVPINTWMTLAFVHDGIDQMELYRDGELIARRGGITRGVPGVGSAGLSIGNDLAGGAPLQGDIDDIKVWRLDPHERERQFFARPMDEAAADCWERYLLRIRSALAPTSKCAAFPAELEGFFRRALRAILHGGPGAREQLLELRRRYDELWRAGTISGPEMRAVIRELHDLLAAAGLAIESDPEIERLVRSECFSQISAEVGPFDCDPAYLALVQAAAEELGLH